MTTRKECLRLIDEMSAVLTPEQIKEIAVSMDLRTEQVEEQLARATEEWEKIKDKIVAMGEEDKDD